MMMMRLLNRTHFSLKSQNLSAIFAHGTIWWWNFSNLLGDPFRKGRQHLFMVVQVPGFYKLNIGVFRSNLIREAVNSINQYAGKEEIREHNNPFITKSACVLQAGFKDRKSTRLNSSH